MIEAFCFFLLLLLWGSQICNILIIVYGFINVLLYYVLDVIYYTCITTIDVCTTLTVLVKLTEMQKVCKTESARKIGRDAENRQTIVLMHARIIFMTVNVKSTSCETEDRKIRVLYETVCL